MKARPNCFGNKAGVVLKTYCNNAILEQIECVRASMCSVTLHRLVAVNCSAPASGALHVLVRHRFER